MESWSGAAWRARTTDGSVYTFGEGDRLGFPGSAIVAHGVARLTSMEDIHGNTVVDFYLQKIAYSGHVDTSSNYAAPFAEVIFNHKVEMCEGGVPAGAKMDFRSGEKYLSGSTRVESITTRVMPPGTPEGVDVRKNHPKAPPGTKQKVEFKDAQPGTKGYKRDPKPEELEQVAQ